MKKLTFTSFIFSFIFVYPLSAQDSLLTAVLQKNAYMLDFKEGKLGGEGIKFLDKVAQESPFFLIGEDHGIAEIPLFTASLFTRFKKHNYQYFATETGPYTAEFLQELGSSKKFENELASFLRKHPWSIPFYGWKEEGNIIKAVTDCKSSKKPLIWGLDQEFAGSFRMHFKYLMENAQSEETKQLATDYYNQTVNAWAEVMKTGNPNKAFMSTANATDFEKLEKAFETEPKNLERIIELKKSLEIYQLFSMKEGFRSNELRAEMMKRYFLKYYNAVKKAGESPKVMFKFGANHMYRGANGLNVFDIGNFITELASQEKTKSFHLYVLGKKGFQNTYTPFSESEDDKQAPYDASNYLDKIDFTPVFSAISEDSWGVVDLRPIRKKLFNREIKNLQPALEKVIWSYDAVLVIPEVTASENVIE